MGHRVFRPFWVAVGLCPGFLSAQVNTWDIAECAAVGLASRWYKMGWAARFATKRNPKTTETGSADHGEAGSRVDPNSTARSRAQR